MRKERASTDSIAASLPLDMTATLINTSGSPDADCVGAATCVALVEILS